MNVYNAIVLLTVMMGVSAAPPDPTLSPITFGNRVHAVNFTIPSGRNAIHFETDGRSVYVASEDLFTIYKFDVGTGGLLASVGGEGEGPGELSEKILRISLIDRHVYVLTGRVIHRYDLDLNFVDRQVLTYMALDIRRMIDGGHLLCTMMMGDIPEPRSSYNMTVVKHSEYGDSDHTRFRLGGEMENHSLSQCLIATNKTMVAATQLGARNVRFHDMAGTLRKRVPVNLANKDISYLDIYQPEFLNRHYKAMGYSDFRIPVGSHVSSVHMSEAYTVVQGGITSEFHTRTVAIIEHGTWRVHYDVLPVECGNFRIAGTQMVCMVSHERNTYFAVYEL